MFRVAMVDKPNVLVLYLFQIADISNKQWNASGPFRYSRNWPNGAPTSQIRLWKTIQGRTIVVRGMTLLERSNHSGPEVIKLFLMLNSTKHETFYCS